MAIRIRTAQPSDAPAIARFNRRMALETEKRRLTPQRTLAGARAVIGDRARGVYYLADLDGAFAGQLLLTFEWSDWRNGNYWWIQSVYVTPECRRRGVFRALHHHVTAACGKDPAACGLRLYVAAHNRIAKRVYAQLGLEPSGYEVLEKLKR